MRALDMPTPHRLPTSMLNRAAQGCFVRYTAGRWLHLAYVVYVFGVSGATCQLDSWNECLHPGYIPGDHVGNLVVAAHLLFAVVVLGAGPLQLMPALRERLPRVHRRTGRILCSRAHLGSHLDIS